MADQFENLTILFLEDEPLIAMDTHEALVELGFKDVRSVSRLCDAEQAAESTLFDVAVLDINVDRGQKSYDLGQQLKDSGVKVIFASGTESERERLIADGYRFLAKPYQQESLRMMISESVSDPQPVDLAEADQRHHA